MGKAGNNKRDSCTHFNSSDIVASVMVEGHRKGIIIKEVQYLFMRLTDTAVKYWKELGQRCHSPEGKHIQKYAKSTIDSSCRGGHPLSRLPAWDGFTLVRAQDVPVGSN